MIQLNAVSIACLFKKAFDQSKNSFFIAYFKSIRKLRRFFPAIEKAWYRMKLLLHK